MINPTHKDIDRKVIYRGDQKARRIIGFDDKWVYATASTEAVCGEPFTRDELDWFSGKDRAQ